MGIDAEHQEETLSVGTQWGQEVHCLKQRMAQVSSSQSPTVSRFVRVWVPARGAGQLTTLDKDGKTFHSHLYPEDGEG